MDPGDFKHIKYERKEQNSPYPWNPDDPNTSSTPNKNLAESPLLVKMEYGISNASAEGVGENIAITESFSLADSTNTKQDFFTATDYMLNVTKSEEFDKVENAVNVIIIQNVHENLESTNLGETSGDCTKVQKAKCIKKTQAEIQKTYQELKRIANPVSQQRPVQKLKSMPSIISDEENELLNTGAQETIMTEEMDFQTEELNAVNAIIIPNVHETLEASCLGETSGDCSKVQKPKPVKKTRAEIQKGYRDRKRAAIRLMPKHYYLMSQQKLVQKSKSMPSVVSNEVNQLLNTAAQETIVVSKPKQSLTQFLQPIIRGKNSSHPVNPQKEMKLKRISRAPKHSLSEFLTNIKKGNFHFVNSKNDANTINANKSRFDKSVISPKRNLGDKVPVKTINILPQSSTSQAILPQSSTSQPISEKSKRIPRSLDEILQAGRNVVFKGGLKPNETEDERKKRINKFLKKYNSPNSNFNVLRLTNGDFMIMPKTAMTNKTNTVNIQSASKVNLSKIKNILTNVPKKVDSNSQPTTEILGSMLSFQNSNDVPHLYPFPDNYFTTIPLVFDTKSDDIKTLKSQMMELHKSLKKAESELLKYKNMEETFKKIFSEAQLRKVINDKRVCWSEKDYKMASQLFKISGTAYRFMLKHNYPLPSQRAVQKWKSMRPYKIGEENLPSTGTQETSVAEEIDSQTEELNAVNAIIIPTVHENLEASNLGETIGDCSMVQKPKGIKKTQAEIQRDNRQRKHTTNPVSQQRLFKKLKSMPSIVSDELNQLLNTGAQETIMTEEMDFQTEELNADTTYTGETAGGCIEVQKPKYINNTRADIQRDYSRRKKIKDNGVKILSSIYLPLA